MNIAAAGDVLGSISPTCLLAPFTSYLLLAHIQIKIPSSCQYLFDFLGSARVKCALKMLVKLTPEEVKGENHNFVLTLKTPSKSVKSDCHAPEPLFHPRN